jgi:hypothetical protein
MSENISSKCLTCGTALSGKRTKFCCQKHAMKWHNDRQDWFARNDREAHNARKLTKYRANPAKGAENAQRWRDAHPEQYRAIAERAKERYWQSPWRKLVVAARGRAKEKKLPCDIDFEWAEARWTGFCEVSGLPFVLSIHSPHRMFSPSIDQIEPKKGYTKTNSRFVLLAVNGMKHDGTDEAMYFVAEAILSNRPKSLINLSERGPLQVPSPEAGDRLGADDVVTDDHHALLSDLTQRDQ